MYKRAVFISIFLMTVEALPILTIYEVRFFVSALNFSGQSVNNRYIISIRNNLFSNINKFSFTDILILQLSKHKVTERALQTFNITLPA